MNDLKRKDFLKKIIVLTIGSVILSKFLQGKSFFKNLIPQEMPVAGMLTGKINEFAIIDLHCHPSLKMYLWNKHIWKRHCTKAGTNTFAMQQDFQELSSGNVKGFMATHYLVEKAITEESGILKNLFPWIKRFSFSLADKLEHHDYSNFTQINKMIDIFESQIHILNEKQQVFQFIIARSFTEFEKAIDEGKIPIAHAIEGAHALGTDLTVEQERKILKIDKRTRKNLKNQQTRVDIEKEAEQQFKLEVGKMKDGIKKSTKYIQNLEALHMRGVCMITLSHFFKNDISFPTEGISYDEKIKIKMRWHYQPSDDKELTRDVGVPVVKKMLELGIIVDLTHSTPKIRRQVFCLNADREKQNLEQRPLTFTHVGSQKVFEKYAKGKFPTFNFYNVSPEDIKGISCCEGVIGVIPENFWLTGCDTNLSGCDPEQSRYGIEYIVETIMDINDQTDKKDFSNIAIGTDFDGLADAPEDLYKASQLTRLIKAMKEHNPPIPEDKIKDITHGNALRLLKKGWGQE